MINEERHVWGRSSSILVLPAQIVQVIYIFVDRSLLAVTKQH